MTRLNTLFARSIRPPRPVDFDPEFGEDVITAFCYVLEEAAPTPGCVADVSELPYPKETIKQALRWRLRRTSDVDFRDTLKVAYVALADWQEGVGATHRGLDVRLLPAGLTSRERAELIAEKAVDGAAWAARSNAEAEKLHRELAALDV